MTTLSSIAVLNLAFVIHIHRVVGVQTVVNEFQFSWGHFERIINHLNLHISNKLSYSYPD